MLKNKLNKKVLKQFERNDLMKILNSIYSFGIEQFGWDNATKKITMSNTDIIKSIVIMKKYIKLNGKEKKLTEFLKKVKVGI